MPRAYIITPAYSNALNVSYGFYAGNLNFYGNLLIKDGSARASIPVLSLFYSFNFFASPSILSVARRWTYSFQDITVAWQYSWFGRPR